jgi:hypothetical protein
MKIDLGIVAFTDYKVLICLKEKKQFTECIVARVKKEKINPPMQICINQLFFFKILFMLYIRLCIHVKLKEKIA